MRKSEYKYNSVHIKTLLVLEQRFPTDGQDVHKRKQDNYLQGKIFSERPLVFSLSLSIST